MTRLFIALIAACIALGACSMSADTAAAEQAVPKFHEQLDAGRRPRGAVGDDLGEHRPLRRDLPHRILEFLQQRRARFCP